MSYEVPELNTHEFDDYNGFSTPTAISTFGPNYFYTAARQNISSISAVTYVVLTVCTISALVYYYMNGLFRRNGPMNVKKIQKSFLSKPDIIFIKTLEAITRLGGFNQRLLMRQYNKKFPHSGPHRHKDDAIDTLF